MQNWLKITVTAKIHEAARISEVFELIGALSITEQVPIMLFIRMNLRQTHQSGQYRKSVHYFPKNSVLI